MRLQNRPFYTTFVSIITHYTAMKRIFSLLVILSITLTASAHKRDLLTYGTPESVGINGKYLNRTIDSIINKSIADRCFPGCQILVARRGKIVFNKSYGYHTYENERIVENNHIYDIASCTKVLGSTLCLMRLVEKKKLSLDKPFSNYFEEFRGTDKESLTLRELLTHQSGLRHINWSKMLLDKQMKHRADVFSSTQSEAFPYQFGKNLYLCKDAHARMFEQIVKRELGKKKFYYTCTPFYCFPTVIERITERNYEEYLYNEFYKPLGCRDITYNPINKYSLERIVPTDKSRYLHKGLIHGFVHDEAAGSLGGVSGNAGLFASAESIAPILQMLLNRGVYGGKRYFRSKTIREWTSCQYPENGNYRGLGFDRRRFDDYPIITPRRIYYAESASECSYGHSGFTGTMIWVDPAEDLIFIFLSNSVHLRRNIQVFNDSNPRAKCHEAVYKAIRIQRGH